MFRATIEVRGDQEPLQDLHEAALAAFDREDDHSYSIYLGAGRKRDGKELRPASTIGETQPASRAATYASLRPRGRLDARRQGGGGRRPRPGREVPAGGAARGGKPAAVHRRPARRGKPEAAERARLPDAAADVSLLIGEMHLKMGEYAKAIEAFTRAIENDPKAADEYGGRARGLGPSPPSDDRRARECGPRRKAEALHQGRRRGTMTKTARERLSHSRPSEAALEPAGLRRPSRSSRTSCTRCWRRPAGRRRRSTSSPGPSSSPRATGRKITTRVLGCLIEFNQGWAKAAPVLMLSFAHLAFDRNGQPNRHAFHDVGLAMANLTVQATDRGPRRPSDGRHRAGQNPHRVRRAGRDGSRSPPPRSAIPATRPCCPRNCAERELAPPIRKLLRLVRVHRRLGPALAAAAGNAARLTSLLVGACLLRQQLHDGGDLVGAEVLALLQRQSGRRPWRCVRKKAKPSSSTWYFARSEGPAATASTCFSIRPFTPPPARPPGRRVRHRR